MPAITALAALVPCAEDGIRQTVRCSSPLARWYAADGQQAGQLALRAGVGLQGDLVVAGDLGEPLLQLADEREVALRLLGRARRGAAAPNSGQVTGSISVVALSFMVQEPSGIMPRSSA